MLAAALSSWRRPATATATLCVCRAVPDEIPQICLSSPYQFSGRSTVLTTPTESNCARRRIMVHWQIHAPRRPHTPLPSGCAGSPPRPQMRRQCQSPCAPHNVISPAPGHVLRNRYVLAAASPATAPAQTASAPAPSPNWPERAPRCWAPAQPAPGTMAPPPPP